MKHFFILSLLLISLTGFSQIVLLEDDIAADTVQETFGPNLKKYRHLFLEYGFIADKPEGDGLTIMYGKSSSIAFGYRMKYKINRFLSFGYDLSLSSWAYRIKGTDDKTFPDSLSHDKEKLTILNLGPDLYFRINFGKRGNIMGKFLDIAGFGNLILDGNYETVDNLDGLNSVNAGKVRVNHTQLSYLDYYNYGVRVRLGVNRYMLTATYRLSDLIKENYNLYPELPRLIVSFQLGLH